MTTGATHVYPERQVTGSCFWCNSVTEDFKQMLIKNSEFICTVTRSTYFQHSIVNRNIYEMREREREREMGREREREREGDVSERVRGFKR